MPSKAELIDGIVVGTGLLIMVLAGKLVPEGLLQSVLIGLGFVIVLGDTVAIEIIFEFITMHYAYLRVDLEPSGKSLHAFIEPKFPKTTQISKDVFSTKIRSHWIMKHPYYGRFIEFAIHHELDWEKRVKLTPGYAVFQGYAIPHPQVGRVICHEYSYSSDRFKHLSIPAFQLAYAYGGDVKLFPPISTATLLAIKEAIQNHPEIVKSGNPGISLDKALSLMRHYDAMRFAVMEKRRETSFYRSEKLRLEQGEESKDSQTKALLAVTTDATKRAWEIVLDWFEITGAIDRIVKRLRAPGIRLLNKYTAMVLIAAVSAVTIGFLAANPAIRTNFGNWMSKLQNQVVLVILAVCGAAFLYFIRKRKS